MLVKETKAVETNVVEVLVTSNSLALAGAASIGIERGHISREAALVVVIVVSERVFVK